MIKKIVVATALLAGSLSAQSVHPDSLSYTKLAWEIPNGAAYRSVVQGTPLYYAEEKLPIFALQLSFQTGEIYGQGSNGVATLYAASIANGGTAKHSPQQLDSLLDLYAINLEVGGDQGTITITLSGLSEQFNRAVDLLSELCYSPAFESSRLERDKQVINDKLSHLFDNPGPVMYAAWKKAIYPNTFQAELLSAKMIKGVKRKQLLSFHTDMMNHAPVVTAFAGSISKSDVDAAILKLLPSNRTPIEPTVVKVTPASTQKLILVHKDITQAYIITGQPIFKRPDPRYYPLSLFNEIVGGGGFNSRLVTKVRSDAGLTYSINASSESNYNFEGTFNVSLFTKSESINHALGLTIETIKSTLAEDLTVEEITEKQTSFIESLPSAFRTGRDIVATYQQNESMGRSIDHYLKYPQELKAITAEQVTATARELIQPDQFTTVIVGDSTALLNAPSWNGWSLKEMKPLIITEEQLINFNTAQ